MFPAYIKIWPWEKALQKAMPFQTCHNARLLLKINPLRQARIPSILHCDSACHNIKLVTQTYLCFLCFVTIFQPSRRFVVCAKCIYFHLVLLYVVPRGTITCVGISCTHYIQAKVATVLHTQDATRA